MVTVVGLPDEDEDEAEEEPDDEVELVDDEPVSPPQAARVNARMSRHSSVVQSVSRRDGVTRARGIRKTPFARMKIVSGWPLCLFYDHPDHHSTSPQTWVWVIGERYFTRKGDNVSLPILYLKLACRYIGCRASNTIYLCVTNHNTM
jgi:hypothetical protein